MAIYFVTGKLGAGKTLCAVGRIRDYLDAGRRVVTNLDLNLEYLGSEKSKASVTRLPDKPRIADLELIGRGHDLDEPNEEKNGLIVLDECLDFLDSRTWRDPERAPVLSWMRHARKLRWDIYFLLQDVQSADAQLVRQLCEHLVTCRRMDRLRLAGFKLPRAHIAIVRYGQSASAPKVQTWIYRGVGLFKAYDTEQCFTDQSELIDGKMVDMRAPYSVLSNWHIKGRYSTEESKKQVSLFNALFRCLSFPAWAIYLVVGKLIKGRPLYQVNV